MILKKCGQGRTSAGSLGAHAPPLPVRNKLYSDSQGGQYLSLELNAITLFSVSFVWRKDKSSTCKLIGLHVYCVPLKYFIPDMQETKCFEFIVQIVPPPHLYLILFTK